MQKQLIKEQEKEAAKRDLRDKKLDLQLKLGLSDEEMKIIGFCVYLIFFSFFSIN